MWSSRPAVHHYGSLGSTGAEKWSLQDFRLSSGEVCVDDADGTEAFVPVASEESRAAEADLSAEIERAELLEAHAAEVELAQAEGYEAGLRQGTESEAARLRSAVQAANLALEQINQESARADIIEENVTALALAIARQIIDREVSADSAIITSLVRSSLTECPIDQPVRVRLNPLDLHLITDNNVNRELAGDRNVTWLSDPAILRGGCVVETRHRIIDGRVDAALERLYRHITQAHD